jgi:hypothetical protein
MSIPQRWQFTMIDRAGKAITDIDEPVGWDTFTTTIKRHPQRHGTMREVQGNTFQFFGKARLLLEAEYKQYRFKGYYLLIIDERQANGINRYHTGIFNFSKYEKTCDDDCYVTIDVDQIGPLVKMLNRWEQKVDLNALKSFDGVTDLTPYNFLGKTITLPSKAIRVIYDASNTPVVPPANNFKEYILTDDTGWIFPTGTGLLQGSIPPVFDSKNKGGENFHPQTVPDFLNFTQAQEYTPEILINSITSGLKCTAGLHQIDFRVKGRYIHGPTSDTGNQTLTLQLKKGGTTFNDPQGVTIHSFPILGPGPLGSVTREIDLQYHDFVTLADNEKLYLTFFLEYFISAAGGVGSTPTVIKMQFDTESYFKASVNSLCEPTDAKVFLINETFSRVVESITDNALKVYSGYYGRTDSQPFSVDVNGCGADTAITNGLRIRNVLLADGTEPLMNVSMKDLFDAFTATDNIGVGIEGENILRIENWRYFYKDAVIHRCENIRTIRKKAQDSEAYATFKVGYSKFEAEETNGLDEFLTAREYRLDIPAISNSFEQVCKFIYSGYLWETTRRKSNDTSDWRYDNDIFAVCLTDEYEVEVNNIVTPANIIDPPTVYNFRRSPARNALRWFNRLAASYANLTAQDKLIFTEAEGNYVAAGALPVDACKLETGVLSENQDIDITNFQDPADGVPFLQPERVVFTYPLGTNDYKKITANPYGLIYFSGENERGYGWIDTITYRPNDGTADFTLIPKI